MKRINKNESGRSMVEMLGVLAIIGVLSVGGIAGYKMAMNKYSVNTLKNLIQMFALASEDENMFVYEYDDVYEQRKKDSETFCHLYLGEEWCQDLQKENTHVMSYKIPGINARWYVGLAEIHNVQTYRLGILMPADMFRSLASETMHAYASQLRYLGNATGLYYNNRQGEIVIKDTQADLEEYITINTQQDFSSPLVHLSYCFYTE